MDDRCQCAPDAIGGISAAALRGDGVGKDGGDALVAAVRSFVAAGFVELRESIEHVGGVNRGDRFCADAREDMALQSLFNAAVVFVGPADRLFFSHS